MQTPDAIETWICRYFPKAKLPEVQAVLTEYGPEPWHREVRRVHRDAVIGSRGSLAALRNVLELANRDYRDVLIGEEVDPWIIGELARYHEETGLEP